MSLKSKIIIAVVVSCAVFLSGYIVGHKTTSTTVYIHDITPPIYEIINPEIGRAHV
jgi:hypothetical protein